MIKRKRIHVVTIYLILTCVFSSCQEAKQRKELAKEHQTQQSFKVPELPKSADTPEKKAEFIIKNYWQNFDFSDTTLIHRPQIAEQAFIDYVNILGQVPLKLAGEGIDIMMKKAEVKSGMFVCFATLCEKYLYDPNSPVRNEELYLKVLDNIFATKCLDDIHKERYRHQYKIALRNRVGHKATDITYKLFSGKKENLYSIEADFTLIYFNNPECNDCGVVMGNLAHSAVINDLLNQGKLKLLAFYLDKDLSVWKKHKADYPSSWINGHDSKGEVVKDKEVYDLKAIPSLYLLDAQKNILLKDARFEEVEGYLKSINN
jgi:hypothetical protein